MTTKFSFRNELVNGIHARPATELKNRADVFSCQTRLLNVTKGTSANMKSVLELVGADVTLGDICELEFDGSDEALACKQLKIFITEEFSLCDEALEVIEQDEGGALPVSLLMASPNYIRGHIVCPGIGQGVPILLDRIDLHQQATGLPMQTAEEIQVGLNAGVSTLIEMMTHVISTSGHHEKEILQAHLQLTSDDGFMDALRRNSNQINIVKVIAVAADELKAPMLRSSSPYLKERALDIEDICNQLAEVIVGYRFTAPVVMTQNSIVIADNLTPSDLLALDKTLLKGLVLTHAGQTSHTIILARSFAIPVLTGVDNPAIFACNENDIIVDALHGILVKKPNPAVYNFYQMECDKLACKQQLLKPYINREGFSKDGKKMAIYANIAIAEESESAFSGGAEGIGLFRTEMMFMDRECAPSEDEQYQSYVEVIKTAKGKQAIIRTLDIGGDKPVQYLGLPAEENPFLGYRAVRMYPEYQPIIETQLRAIMRASAFGPVDIMVPMVSCVAEVKWMHELCLRCEDTLNRENVVIGAWRLGIMVEVPSTLYLLDKITQWIDFVSIGSNDLTQYFMACDRGNQKVKGLYNSMEPSFLALLNDIAIKTKKAGLELGICGEMAGDINALPLLLAMGFDEISMSSSKIPATRAQLSQFDFESCQALLNDVLAVTDATVVLVLIDKFFAQINKPAILDPKLVIHNCKLRDKVSVIKVMTDALELHGRANKGYRVEQAIWDREAIFATSLGFGIAIPHCKSEDVTHNSISVTHLAQPIVWNEKENGSVSTVIMLSISSHDDDGSHMNIFSRLARKLVHKSFRDSLENANNPQETITILNACLFDN